MRSSSAKRVMLRLLRMSAIAALGVLAARRLRSRTPPPEGVWREGISGNGLPSSHRN